MVFTSDNRDDNERRIERMNAWIELAKATPDESDAHIRFLFYWIAYEAGYHQDENQGPGSQRHRGRGRRRYPQDENRGSGSHVKERAVFHSRLVESDSEGRLLGILRAQENCIVEILELRQAHPSFWRARDNKGVKSAEEWEDSFKRRVQSSVDRLRTAVRPDSDASPKTISGTLNVVFENLSIVRHQIVHGASAGPGSRGRTQVVLGAGLLKAFIPHFRDIIKSKYRQDWGKPPFPRVGSAPDEKCPPPWL